MKIRITQYVLNPIEVELSPVESITLVRGGHEIKCFGNDPVLWYHISRIEILSLN